jgi:proton-dependent oligopeptide transporter, POT family
MKQPKALKILFFTEMWERFGFYTTQSLLVLYLIEKFTFSDADAYAILGQVTALIYLGPVIGGWACDRFLGCRFSILLGGFFLCFGYALIAVENHTLFTGLSFLVLGNSLLKPNISSFLGQFYTKNDSRREAGFTLFYVGINIGVILATSSAGYIQKIAGWGACFGAASFALLIGISIFRWGYRYLEDKGLPLMEHTQTLFGLLRKKPRLVLWFLAALTLTYYSLTYLAFGSYALYAFGLGFLGYMLKASFALETQARKKIWGLLVLFLVTTVFFALWFQVFFAVNVFTDRAVDRMFFGYIIPTPVFIGLDSLFVILLGPILAIFWKRVYISVPAKFALALLFCSLGMYMLAYIIADASVALPMLWLVLFYFIITAGEMLISPIGLSMVTAYAPKEYTSLMMGGLFMSMGFGGKLTGFLASYVDVPEGIANIATMNTMYHQVFQQCAFLGFCVFLVFLLFVPLLKKWLNE